eukprot:CAMPEP_0195577790 /NCGR_PEP_ID=MMETSP0814-20130614/10918_1 /TAXON_ID=97485 /ORGANISM="Prymnesium parvum, Strain Texoma1" /LENGTH=44 /DNA_ID= /DNA_START= /DNA_END= /DNA_ORIENTATION=
MRNRMPSPAWPTSETSDARMPPITTYTAGTAAEKMAAVHHSRDL